MQPNRHRIIQALKEAGKPMYIEQIAEKTGEKPRNTSFHLVTLADYGLVSGEFRENEAPKPNPGFGKAAKYYQLTEKYYNSVKRLSKIIQ